MKLDQALVDAAIQFIEKRFPTGVEGATAVYLEDGQILVSTAPPVPNDSASLCHETGAICDAYELGKRIMACICVSRDERGFHILSPCGVCQERLWAHGGEVECGVPDAEDSTRWRVVTLRELSPYYWRLPFMNTTEAS